MMELTLIEIYTALEPLEPIAFLCGGGLVAAYIIVRITVGSILAD